MNLELENWLEAENERNRAEGLEREFRTVRVRDGKRVVLADGREFVDFASTNTPASNTVKEPQTPAQGCP